MVEGRLIYPSQIERVKNKKKICRVLSGSGISTIRRDIRLKRNMFCHIPNKGKPAQLCEDCKKMVVFRYQGDYRICPRCGTETSLKNIEQDDKDFMKINIDRRFKEFKK